tara:strand:- start:790 stop:1482 length:693 start_codon:yes stop_codon:yes gene_type:complete
MFLRKIKFIDSEHFLNKSIDDGKKVLGEGAQGSLLDIDFGTYPYVTSSNTTSAGACTGLGIAPNKINKVFGIFKAYTTRVGSGPFPTELFDPTGERMAKVGNEFGATTGRPRRCGWLDLVSLKHSITVNGVTDLIMMKGDVLSGIDKIKVCTKYNYNGKSVDYMPFSILDENIDPIYEEIDGWEEDITQAKSYNDLPLNFKNYVEFLEDKLKLKIKIVSVGPDRKQTIFV